jgi:hypothetical protein
MHCKTPVARMTKIVPPDAMSNERRRTQDEQLLSLIDRVQILVQDFIHGEHMDLFLLEDPTHRVIADNVPPVIWIL